MLWVRSCRMGRGSGRGSGGGLTKLKSGTGDDHDASIAARTTISTCTNVRGQAQNCARHHVLTLLMEQASLTQENLLLMEVCPQLPRTGIRLIFLSLLCIGHVCRLASLSVLPTPPRIQCPLSSFFRGSSSIHATHLTPDPRANTRRPQVCRDL